MPKDLTTVFRKLHRIRVKQSASVLDVITFPTVDGEQDTIELPPSIIAKTQSLISSLLDNNAALPASAEARKEIARKLSSETPSRFLIRESSTGWTNRASTYVFSRGAVGKDADTYVGGPLFSDEFRAEEAGNLETWRRSVSKLAMLSSPWVCAVCTAFAAPLLKFSGIDPFTLCLSGKTHSGKSIGTVLAASAVGFGQKEQLPTWQITNARLQERLPAYNDSVFPIDDLENSDDTEKDQYRRIRALSYKIANGSGTERSKTYNKTHGLSHEKWRLIALTSAENTISRKASNTGERRKRGEALRLIDLPVISDETGDIFDRYPVRADREDWRRSRFARAALACERNHGVVQRIYISALINLGEGLKPIIQQQVEEFLSLVATERTTDEATALARRFGLLFAGGAMAIRFKLVEWTISDLKDAIANCFLRARRLLPDEDNILREGRSLLAGWLATASMQLKKGEMDENIAARLNGMGDVFLIRRTVFNGIFNSRAQQVAVEEWLRQSGLIGLGNHRDAQEQHQWPDGERRRSVKINWPKTSRSNFIRT